MIMFWNRREVYGGFSIQDFSKFRNILVSENIKYSCRTVNHSGARNIGMGRTWENPECSAMYYIYVHKRDIERVPFA